MHKFFYIFFLLTTGLLFAEYKNTNGVASDKSFADMLKWIRSDVEPEITKIELSSEWQDLDLSGDDNYAIWIGHSTFLIKKNGVTILTDPIFSDRASPLRNIGPKRLIPPAIPLGELPNIDIVTVSHNHYDHLDISSLKKIAENHPEAIFLVPAGDKNLLKRKKIVKELLKIKKDTWDLEREFALFTEYLKSHPSQGAREDLIFSLMIEEHADQSSDYPSWSKQVHLETQSDNFFALVNPILLKLKYKEEYMQLPLKNEVKKKIEGAQLE